MRLRITIVQRGSVKDRAIQGLCAEYCKRFRAFGSLQIIEQKQSRWPTDHLRVLCDERGSEYSSVALAQQCARWSEQHGAIAFALGDGDGHHPDFANQAQEHFSLSQLTLPHRLAHLLVVEQVYRVGTILAGHPYHH